MSSETDEPAALPHHDSHSSLGGSPQDGDPIRYCNLAWDATMTAAEAVAREDVDEAVSVLEERGQLIEAIVSWTQSTASQVASDETRQAVYEWVRRLQAGDGAIATALEEAVSSARQERSDLVSGRNAIGSYRSAVSGRPEAEFVDRKR